jgi:hypothetical protein
MAEDPRHAGPTPPQPEQQQEPPGHTAEITPQPNHGKESYKGCGKLEGRTAISPAVIQVLAARSPLPSRAKVPMS